MRLKMKPTVRADAQNIVASIMGKMRLGELELFKLT